MAFYRRLAICEKSPIFCDSPADISEGEPMKTPKELHYDLLTEAELIHYLRIPQVSKARDFHNVIDNLKRFHDLPRIYICRQPLYPRYALEEWIRTKTIKGK